VLPPKEQRGSKLESVCEVGVMVGYPSHARGYRILLRNDAGQYYVTERRNVVFDETRMGVAACFGANVAEARRSTSGRTSGQKVTKTSGQFS
jgi:hypothetical protein